jgi:hypothetical protein
MLIDEGPEDKNEMSEVGLRDEGGIAALPAWLKANEEEEPEGGAA